MSATRNPVLYAVIGIPLATVLAGFATLYVAVQSNGYELPPEYAWEGAALDADLERAQAARDQGLAFDLRITASGRIEARLKSLTSSPLPNRLQLTLTHTTLPELDQTRVLERVDTVEGRYIADGSPLPEGAWWVEVAHDSEWRLRGKLGATFDRLQLGSTQ
jgi:hypothetical protein